MAKYDNTLGVARRTMVLFFLIDKSRSMEGSKIGAVNVAMSEVIPEIQKIAEESADANIKIAVLTFSTKSNWLYSSTIDAKDFKWNDLSVDAYTDMGSAFTLLNEKLSRNGGFMIETAGSYSPAIFLMSDGQPTDEYEKPLKLLKNNQWFKASLKVAIAIGEDADKVMLAEFTGNSESVLTVHTPEALKQMIRFTSITASKIGSKSSPAPIDGQNLSKQEDFNNQIVDFSETLADWDSDSW